VIGRVIRRLVGKPRARRWIERTAERFGIDLLLVAYNAIGVLNYETPAVSGEEHLIRDVLPRVIRSATPTLLDVGANRGEMSLALRAAFPRARILAFEPNPVTYEKLLEATRGLTIECIRAGLGANESTGMLHSYRDDPTSGHASVYRDVFRLHAGYGVAAANDLTTFEFPIRTIDSLGLDHIDFLKIDVEGYELEVLRGARAMLAGDRIDTIQFEFNEMNVLSRTFLRDFYELLPRFAFYRLAPRHLIPLGPYATRNEIFQFQNLFAVRSGIDV
jgi:FkbM family methyltransferase